MNIKIFFHFSYIFHMESNSRNLNVFVARFDKALKNLQSCWTNNFKKQLQTTMLKMLEDYKKIGMY